jgi:hypothetical protein
LSGPILGTIAAMVLLFDRRRFFAARDSSTAGQQEATAWTGG